jgi:signal transduction histidine kinase
MKPRNQSLRRRIVQSTALVSAVAMLATILTVQFVLSTLSDKSINQALEDRVGAASATLGNVSGVLTEFDTADEAIDETTWIFDLKGDQLAGPRLGSGPQAAAESLSDVHERTRLTKAEHQYLAAPVRHDGRTIAVVVASEFLEPYEATRTAVLVGLVALGAIVTAGSAGVAWWTMRRALAPVESMAARAEEWSEHDLVSRFEDSERGDEFARLGRTLNILLDRVANAIRGEQQLTSELAHELRTPLTAIRGQAELGAMETPDEDSRYANVVALADQMNVTMTTLLSLARGQQHSGNRAEVADIVTTSMAGITAPGVDMSFDVPTELEIAVPRDLAVRALAPIVVNATQYARKTVRIAAVQHERTVHISITDDGPGVYLDEPDEIFTAGVHGTDSQGVGLGLALSRRVARTLGGDVTMTVAHDPTTFTLMLPRF